MTDEHESDTDTDLDELLNWLCWTHATTGERFYPPDETARECIDALSNETDSPRHEKKYAQEYGQHGRAWGDAIEFFDDLYGHGLDPVYRANYYVEQARAEGDDLSRIDWAWLEDSHYDGPIETPNECGEYHSLPCGVDRECPDTGAEQAADDRPYLWHVRVTDTIRGASGDYLEASDSQAAIKEEKLGYEVTIIDWQDDLDD